MKPLTTKNLFQLQEEALFSRRKELVERLAVIDARRDKLKERIKAAKRLPGFSKEEVAELQERDSYWKGIRLKVQQELGQLSQALRDLHIATAKGNQRVKVNLAVAFQQVVRRSVTREQYNEWLATAKKVPT